MRKLVQKTVLVLSCAVLPASLFAMGKKPDTADSKVSTSPAARDASTGINPAHPNSSGAPAAPAGSALTPVEDVQKPVNPNLPAVTGTSGTTGTNGTGMGSGTSH